VAGVPIAVPGVTTQRRIAAVLSAFDELTEINERRIALLEDLARSLYREWFVRFRFPGHEEVALVDSELGPIPEGWTMTKLRAVASIEMGQSPRSEFYNQTGAGLPFHQGVAGYGTLLPTHDKYCTVEARMAEPSDVLCSVRAPVGRLNLADQRIVIGRGLSAVRRTDGSQAFLLLQLRQALGEEDSIGGGTIYKAVGKAQLACLPVLEPDRQWVERFEGLARPMLDERVELTLLNRQLAATRDLLLPRLVTGRLDISHVDLGALTPTEAE
jgi:type I restriction enzyme S subunit